LKESGFTLVELVAVIVLLGILAVTALPRFINLKSDANIAVTSSIMSSFYTSASQFHLKWIVQGTPASITINGNNVLMSTEGYPDSTTADSVGCLEIWSNIMDTSINVVTYPGAVSTPEWSALRFGPACVYINHNGNVFNNTETPFFSYFPTTGTGVGFNLD
jgi:prepilin-type N-terminal cleavage/methylation domain-containing protein